jgi:hypothetical protein
MDGSQTASKIIYCLLIVRAVMANDIDCMPKAINNDRISMITKEHVLQQYLDNLSAANYDAVISLFTDNALVISPLYGQVPAFQFYKDLFKDTQSSQLKLINMFIGTYKPDTAALQFEYLWTMANGEVVTFEVVDIIDFDSNNKIVKLSIIYDTYYVRPVFAANDQEKRG